MIKIFNISHFYPICYHNNFFDLKKYGYNHVSQKLLNLNSDKSLFVIAFVTNKIILVNKIKDTMKIIIDCLLKRLKIILDNVNPNIDPYSFINEYIKNIII